MALKTIVRGYHLYKQVWSTTVGQVLPCKRERGNVRDLYSVAIVHGNIHAPRAIPAVCLLFLRGFGWHRGELT